jgi:hypothetical protein
MIIINGAIEKIDGKWIYGWARPIVPLEEADESSNFEILVFNGDTIIGSDAEMFFRPDLGGDFGFRIECTSTIDALTLVSNRLRVEARLGVTSKSLRVLPQVRSHELASLLSAAMEDFSLSDIDRVLEVISKLPAALDLDHVAARISPEKQNTIRLLDMADSKLGEPRSVADLTYVPMSVGFVSSDGTAVIGKQGEIYLVGGGNRVLEQFLQSPEDSIVQETVARWHAAIIDRARVVKAAGSQFIQMIIPEKLSVYPAQFPGAVTTPSPILRLLEERLDEPDSANFVVFGLRELIGAIPPEKAFPRYDSHLTSLAAYTVFSAQLRLMGLSNPFPLDQSAKLLGVGDLAERFFGVPLYEEWSMPGLDFISSVSGGVDLIFKTAPVEGHVGTNYVWKNASAPIDLKVVAFANSFFERGGSARSLSWWACRAFREFRFIWSPDLDMDYVRQTNPDWVICQTIERFLPRTPQDTL